MIAGTLLCVVAWLVFGVTGAPVDPFLPLVAALALRAEWPPWARIAGPIALGPASAAATGDLALERTALYAAIALLALGAGRTVRDGVITRTGLVAASLVAVLAVRALLAAAGTVPAPGQTALAVAATVVWTALHATATLGLERVRARAARATP